MSHSTSSSRREERHLKHWCFLSRGNGGVYSSCSITCLGRIPHGILYGFVESEHHIYVQDMYPVHSTDIHTYISARKSMGTPAREHCSRMEAMSTYHAAKSPNLIVVLRLCTVVSILFLFNFFMSWPKARTRIIGPRKKQKKL